MARKRLITTMALLALVVGVGIAYERTQRRASRSTEVENQLRRDLHTGMSRAEIEAYLNQNGIEHSYVEKFDKGKSVERTVIARIRDRSTGLVLVKVDVGIQFKFDEAGRLTSYTVEEFLIGV